MKRRLVIADDDPTIISLLRLGLAGYDVLSAGSGAEALALIRAAEPVAAILDVNMPGGDGLSVLDQLKSDPRTARLPVMMLTGERSNDMVLTAVGSGASDYMVKPFDPGNLQERVGKLVRTCPMVWDHTNAKPAPVWEIARGVSRRRAGR